MNFADERSRFAEFRQHWPALLAATVGVGLSVTALPFFTAGIFVGPLHDAFGWSRAQIASANTALYWAVGLASPLAGAAVDRAGVRAVVLLSMTALAAGFAVLSVLGGSLAGFVATTGVMGFLGAGASAIAFTRVVNARFERARGLALGLCLMGSGIMGMLAPPVLEEVIAGWGWRWGYRALAGCLLLALPLMLLLDSQVRSASAAIAARAGPSPVRDRRFWLLLGSVILMSYATMGASYHLAPLLTDLTGSAQTAARQAGLLGASVMLTRVISGYALDHVFAPFVGALVAAAGALACVLLSQGESTILAVILLGAALGAEFDLMAYLTSRYFPPESYGRIYGAIFGVSVVVSGISPFLVGALYDVQGDYRIALGLAAAALVAAAPVMLALGRYPRPVPAVFSARPIPPGPLAPRLNGRPGGLQ